MKVDAGQVLKELPLVLAKAPPVVLATQDDGDGAIPAELRQWLVRLRLLDGVPFAYLLPDTALLQGALAVGTVNSDDRTQLTARYPGVRDELDREERNLRRAAGSDRYTGDGGPISGFLLRSRAVSGWPAMHVRAFSVDPGPDGDDAKIPQDQPGRVRLLRLERLAPAVLLCLFDGIPTVVHLEEPRQGVQFGFEQAGQDDNLTATLKPRNATTFEYLSVPPVEVPFRVGAPGVVDIQRLERRLKPIVGGGAADTPVTIVFKPTVTYQVMVEQVFAKGGH